jgi:hypothetical protein
MLREYASVGYLVCYEIFVLSPLCFVYRPHVPEVRKKGIEWTLRGLGGPPTALSDAFFQRLEVSRFFFCLVAKSRKASAWGLSSVAREIQSCGLFLSEACLYSFRSYVKPLSCKLC